ncbi:family 20 glycosylhydrolase [Streptomyces sp. AC495_CC817]|uniref:family 20 glycosylhydrolase n=1 Tax=Streptomyces sp. AC495_CC817 TaxID=2823900 RepID=UPI001C25D50B|nr:family 20 glycosylhydrolase [Streptomyces sp. AC495_CC817]
MTLDAESAGPLWAAIPQPTTVTATGGLWRPSSVRVVAESPEFAREAVRLERELTAAGVGGGDRSVVRLARRAGEGEAFEIEVGDDVQVTSATAAGVFRATRQLLHNLRAQGGVPRGAVRSAPAVRERGFHLDAARAYFPAARIVELLHALADVGVNSFQWHVSENEGFRIGSEAFPEVVSPAHVTRAEARAIADVAVELHIDLVPSLDMPGHLRHVLSAHPEHRLPAPEGIDTTHALDITDEEAVRFAHALIDDLAPLFPHSSHWNLGGDEFVDFARIADHPVLAEAAVARFGGRATGFDLLTDFVNRTAAHLRTRGFAARAWNDGMLRGEVVALDPGVTLTWWTNWHAQMRPLSAAVDAGHDLVNVNDGLFYYVLGEKAGYRYPTVERIWEADWHPGLFPSLPDGTVQELRAPYPEALVGAAFAVWSDDPDAQTVDEVFAGVRSPLRAMAERAWNGGSRLSAADFAELDALIGLAPAPVLN